MGVDAGKKAGSILDDIQKSIDRAMDECKLEIAGAVTELVSDIREGKKNVVRHIHSERVRVQEKFTGMLGNMAPEDVDTAKETPTVQPVRPTASNGAAS